MQTLGKAQPFALLHAYIDYCATGSFNSRIWQENMQALRHQPGCSSSIRSASSRRPLSLQRAAVPRQLSKPRISPIPCSSADAAAASTSGRASEDEIAAAWTLLKAFSAAQFRGLSQQYVVTPDARTKLRGALLLAYENPSPAEGWGAASAAQSGPDVLMGVCASDSRLGLRALRDWCQALQLEYVMPDCKVTGADSIAAVTGAVYIKYNAISKFCYLAEYKGSERGVLVQLGQGPMLGHFPLGLFDEAMSNPEPAMKPTAAPAASGSGSS